MSQSQGHVSTILDRPEILATAFHLRPDTGPALEGGQDLFIHAEFDYIIPTCDARALCEGCPSQKKTF
ncbi:MAG: hypothetical protein R6U55_06205, partial [Desulfovermiculus sp.]